MDRKFAFLGHLGDLGIEVYSKVKVMRSQYSFTELTLVAEVGGYVGLFLGTSFVQFSDGLKWIASRILHWKSRY